jgi:hypothetical protein
MTEVVCFGDKNLNLSIDLVSAYIRKEAATNRKMTFAGIEDTVRVLCAK